MNALTKIFAEPLAKALTAMRHPARGIFGFRLLARTRFDYRREVGDMLDASVVTGPVQWLQRSLPEARLSLRRQLRGGKVEELPGHDMLALIRRPNDFYGDVALWFGTVLSYCIDGNAYWIKVRNRAGRVVELWYVPHWTMEPMVPIGGGGNFLDHYRYSPGAEHGIMEIAPEDVVHFRHGINPRNLLKGLSPLDGVIREIFADLESSNFVASLLRNMGVPGVVISPKGGAMPAKEDVEATKAWFQQEFGGDRRGGPLVMGAPTDVQPYGFNPQQMNLSEARDVAEERVCVSLGVPAAVVGFGAGLQQTKVGATMKELRQLAWHNGVLPLARSLADELGRSLLPDFPDTRRASLDGYELYWDTDDVPALQEDEDKQIERKLKEWERGAITLYEYRTETGREADESHKFYVRPINLLEVPVGEAGKRVESDPGNEPKGLPAPETKDRKSPCSACEAEFEEADLEEGRCGTCRAGEKADSHAGHDHADLSDAPRAGAEDMKRGEAFVTLLQRQERGLRTAFERPLNDLFGKWGDQASAAALQILKKHGEKALKIAGPDGEKADDAIIAEILALLQTDGWQDELRQAYGAHYLEVVSRVLDVAEQAGLGTMLPDPIARAVVATGGRRAGLIDLDKQTRQAVFDALAEGRAEGEGAQALANRIANMVEGGPWSDGITRARIIARTETKFAQNLSTIEAAKAAGVDRLMVFDGRLGPGRSLEEHMARNGSIVSAEDALVMAAEEHPNGTLSFAPYFGLDED
jgi:HK97 family phage portal protein